jgi:hypothetical protein
MAFFFLFSSQAAKDHNPGKAPVLVRIATSFNAY